jgi:hypothetical protein
LTRFQDLDVGFQPLKPAREVLGVSPASKEMPGIKWQTSRNRNIVTSAGLAQPPSPARHARSVDRHAMLKILHPAEAL